MLNNGYFVPHIISNKTVKQITEMAQDDFNILVQSEQ